MSNSGQRQITWGATLSYSLIFFNIIVGLLYTPWMIAKIGRDDYGMYVLVTSFLAYFTADYGLSQSINKIVAQAHSKGDKGAETEAISVATSLYLIIDVVIAIVLGVIFLYIDSIYGHLGAEKLHLFKVLFLIASVFALLSFPFLFLHGVFMAKEFFVKAQTLNFAKRIGVIVVTVVLLYFDFGVISLVIAFGAVPFVIHLYQAWYLRRMNVKCRFGMMKRSVVKAILGLSLWLFLIVLAEFFLANISPTILAKVSTMSEIAVFAIGLTLYNYVYLFSGALNGFFLPKIYRYLNSGNQDGLDALSALVSNIQIFIAGFFSLGILLLGQQFIKLWLGPSFHNSYWVAVLLLIPTCVTLCQAIEGQQLLAKDKLQYKSYMMLGAAALSLTLSIFFCRIYGAIGAAIAICIGNICFNIVGQNIIYHTILGRNMLPFFIGLGRYILGFAIIAAIFYFTRLSVWGSGWGNLILNGCIFTLLYAVVIYFTALSKAAKQRFVAPILRRFS